MPVVALTVATAALEDVHVPPAAPFVVNVVVAPIHVVCVPLKTPATAPGITVIKAASIAEHPFLLTVRV